MEEDKEAKEDVNTPGTSENYDASKIQKLEGLEETEKLQFVSCFSITQTPAPRSSS